MSDTNQMEHPTTCVSCNSVFDAWAYSLPQRKRGGMTCPACQEGQLLAAQKPTFDDGGEARMMAGMAHGNRGLAEYGGLELDRPDGTGCYGCGGRGCESCNWEEPD